MFKAILTLGVLWVLTLSPDQNEKKVIKEYINEYGQEVVIHEKDGHTYSTTYLKGGDSLTIELK